MDISAFLEEFRIETEENLEHLAQGLLALERDPSDATLVRGLFLNAHTIKGGAGMLELKVMKQITHSLEDVLGRLRDGGEVLEASTASLLLKTVDTLRQIVRTEPTLEHPSPEMLELLAALRERASGVIFNLPAVKTSIQPQKLVLLLEPHVDPATRAAFEASCARRVGYGILRPSRCSSTNSRALSTSHKCPGET